MYSSSTPSDEWINSTISDSDERAHGFGTHITLLRQVIQRGLAAAAAAAKAQYHMSVEIIAQGLSNLKKKRKTKVYRGWLPAQQAANILSDRENRKIEVCEYFEEEESKPTGSQSVSQLVVLCRAPSVPINMLCVHYSVVGEKWEHCINYNQSFNRRSFLMAVHCSWRRRWGGGNNQDDDDNDGDDSEEYQYPFADAAQCYLMWVQTKFHIALKTRRNSKHGGC